MRIVATVTLLLSLVAADVATAAPRARLKAFSSCKHRVDYARDSGHGDFSPPPQVLAQAVKSRKDQLTLIPAGSARYVSMNTTVPRQTIERGFMPVLLSDSDDRGPIVMGIALLASGTGVKPPRSDLVRAIGRCLRQAGDTVSRGI